MVTANILFVFSNPSTQWVALNGSNAASSLCSPMMVVTNDGGPAPGGGRIVVPSGTASNLRVGQNLYTAYPSQGSTLTVAKQTDVSFSFSVVDAQGGTRSYFLAGIAVKNMSGSGGMVFPNATLQSTNGGSTLSVEDNNVPTRTSPISYDFWLLVQNATGDVGLIDPLITNMN